MTRSAARSPIRRSGSGAAALRRDRGATGRDGPDDRVARLRDRRCPTTSPNSSPRAGAPGDARRHHDAARRRARVRQRLQAPGDPRQGARHDGRAVRRPRRDRPRRRVDDQRLRATRHPLRPRRACASTGSSRASPSSAVRMGPGRSTSPASTTRSPTTTAGPKPVQSPCPPILIGGGGPGSSRSPREADIVGINGTLSAGSDRPEAFATMTARGRGREGRHRRRRGRRADRPTSR
jgi:hypothetical protein